ncbi:MAG TPA: NADPH-dependent FMN reductase [Pseudomonas sp.]|nr:NADPH-dependent FMN reductase [Pseudomonas sp.]MBB49794.1 NADPH-dependent FMN reductase [Pseudomonadales bacterium]HCA24182.1 NADPH-dependent FMN reductase [Pseudomonas sp.]|tara:strand:- start:3287 stop:3877 length:591 start_codon:yes stop_codon:yes gene_type:complete
MSRHIALIAGSSQPSSQSAKVAHWLAATLQRQGCETSVIELGQQTLPLWPEADSKGVWPELSATLRSANALVVISPEWHGMASPALKNLFMYAGRRELAHKPALLVGVSGGQGGSYPLAELRASSYKNCRVCYLPEHLIVRNAEQVMNPGEPASDDDQRIRARADWAMALLLDYTDALAPLHERHRSPPADWMNGM